MLWTAQRVSSLHEDVVGAAYSSMDRLVDEVVCYALRRRNSWHGCRKLNAVGWLPLYDLRSSRYKAC